MWVKVLLLFFVFSFLFRTDDSFNQDLGRHLKLGEIILQTKTVPLTNLFSYTYPDFPFINTHWLFEALTYLMNQAAGLQAFLVIKVIILLISVYLILKIVPKENSILLLPIGFIFLHVLRERTELRPEIFSFFFTAGTYYILEKYLRRPTKLVYLLPLIQLLWINTHIYFFVGLVLQAIFAVHLIYQHLRSHIGSGKLKIMAIIFSLSVAVSLINPYGLTTLLYPLNVTKNYGYTIAENQTMFLLESINFRDHNFLFVKIAIAIIILSLVIAFLKRKFEVKNLLMAGFGLVLALLNIRSFPYLIFLSLPATLQTIGEVRKSSLTKILIIIFSGILLLESYFYLSGDYYRGRDEDNMVGLKLVENGKKALDFVLDKNLPNPIYNNFDIGSYILYRGYPKYRVFVDGRPEGYPAEFFRDIYIPSQYDPQKFKELDQKIGFKTIIFSITDQTPWGKAFLASIVKNTDWKTVYIDDFLIILVKKDILASQGQALQMLDLSKLDPGFYPFDSYLSYLKLSLFLIQTGNQQAAQKFARVALSIFPESPLGNALFGIEVKNKFFW
ncbi:MAG: hypothetical protein Q7R82_02635 [Candidatus Daviesbacteria bacterium]|nr:hypothetical protein [Candidatus Daviesbacteria bacterium]